MLFLLLLLFILTITQGQKKYNSEAAVINKYKYKYKYKYFIHLIVAKLQLNITAETEPIIRYSFSMFIGEVCNKEKRVDSFFLIAIHIKEYKTFFFLFFLILIRKNLVFRVFRTLRFG